MSNIPVELPETGDAKKNLHLNKKRLGATVLGCLAVLFWSTSIAFVRTLSEDLGNFTTASYNYLFSGVISTVLMLAMKGSFAGMRSLSLKYVFGCGSLFVLYTVCLYTAVGFAQDRAQILEIGLINYLWPGLTIVFSVLILGRKARKTLLIGIGSAVAGTVFVTMSRGDVSINSMVSNICSNWFPYTAAGCGAVFWALYSTLSRHWGGEGATGVPLFFLASGIVTFIIKLNMHEQPNWTGRTIAEFLWMAFFTTIAAYIFWDIAVRKGNIVLAAIFSYLAPVFSTFVIWVHLGEKPGVLLWAGCGCIVLGAVVCKLSVKSASEHGAD